mmetsp:Transcript_49482/g.115734  ORF Transcript_49482/g.115734 Transcript_49482/m.115734 type:complete len:488 (+) Transcript_49482:85-1548(+)
MCSGGVCSHAVSAKFLLVVSLNWLVTDASRPLEAQDPPTIDFQLPSGLSPQLLGELLAVDDPDARSKESHHSHHASHPRHRYQRTSSLLATKLGRSDLAEMHLRDLRTSHRSHSQSHMDRVSEQAERTSLCCCDWKGSSCQSGTLEQPFFDIYGTTRDMCCRQQEASCEGGGTKAAALFCTQQLQSLEKMVEENAKLKAMVEQEDRPLQAGSRRKDGHDPREAQSPYDVVRKILRDIGDDYLVHADKVDNLEGALAEAEHYSESKIASTAEYVLAEAKAIHRQNALEHLRALAQEQSLITNSTEEVGTHEQNIKTFEEALKEDLRREERLDQAQAKYQELVPLLPGEEELLMNSSKLARGVEVDSDREVGTPPSAMQSIITNAIRVHRHHAAQHKTSLAQEERAKTDASANLNLHVKAAETIQGFIQKDAARAKVLQKATVLLNEVRRIVAGEENENEHTSLSNSMQSGTEARRLHLLDQHRQNGLN